jgi:hypothetical protein
MGNEMAKMAVEVGYNLSLWLSSNGATHQVNVDLSNPTDRIIHTIVVNGKVLETYGSEISVHISAAVEPSGEVMSVIIKAGDDKLKCSNYSLNSLIAAGNNDRFVLSTVQNIIRDLGVFSCEFSQFVQAMGVVSFANLGNLQLNRYNITVDPMPAGAAAPAALGGAVGAAAPAAPAALGGAAGAAAPAALGGAGAAAFGSFSSWEPPGSDDSDSAESEPPRRRLRSHFADVGRKVARCVKGDPP